MLAAPEEKRMPAIFQPSHQPLRPALPARAPEAIASAGEAPLEEVRRRTNELLATVAHELRNPLESLGNAVEILSLAHADAAVAGAAARVARRQLEQMSRLIGELLDAGGLASGQLALSLARVRLQDVLENAIETSAPALSRRHHTLKLELPQEPVWIRADAVRCSQIFCNLLANAAKYTPPGGCITLAARQERDLARVCVIDNGVGIAPGALQGVFELFRQEERSRSMCQGGLGIGLSVVSRLVQLHGGSVHAESAGEHQGSTFVVELPLYPGKTGIGLAASH
jgi:signal transduction histidine kinase